ncbi:MAG: hypothetical protein E7214_02430 [Clostridium sp.]|nr:hypothetical protein [Clostridium sp.]
MRILLYIFIYSYVFMLLCSYVISFINKRDNSFISINNYNKFFIFIVNGLSLSIIYIFSTSIFDFITKSILISFLIIIAYIDFKTSYVYDIISYPLLIFSIIIFIINVINNIVIANNLKGILLGLLVVLIFEKLNYIGQGDVKVFISIFLFINNNLLCPIFIIIFSMGISGIYGIYLFLVKKVDLNYRKPLCPSIYIATLLFSVMA